MCTHSDETIQWQLDRMDMTRDAKGNWIDGTPTWADAIAVLDEVAAEG